MAKPLRAVQIGAGSFCEQFHAPTLKRLAEAPDARLSLEAICDLDQERAEMFARTFGYARVYADFMHMMEEVKPDVIYCMVQPTATAGVLTKLLPLGIPLFTEKPPGVTVREAESLADLAEQHRVLNYVAFNRRAMPSLRRLRKWACAQGPLRYVRAEMLRNRRLEAHFAFETAIHSLDFLRFVCGNVVAVETRCNSYPDGAARDFHVRLCFESGVLADLAVLVDCGFTRERYLAQLQNQSIEVLLGYPYSSPFCDSGEKIYCNNELVSDEPACSDPLVNGGFVGEHELFLDAVEQGRLPGCCLQDARHSLRLAMAVHEQYSGPINEFVPRTSA